MLGAVLLFLVIVNAFLTGWLLASYLRTRRVVSRLLKDVEGLTEDVSDLTKALDRFTASRLSLVGGDAS